MDTGALPIGLNPMEVAARSGVPGFVNSLTGGLASGRSGAGDALTFIGVLGVTRGVVSVAVAGALLLGVSGDLLATLCFLGSLMGGLGSGLAGVLTSGLVDGFTGGLGGEGEDFRLCLGLTGVLGLLRFGVHVQCCPIRLSRMVPIMSGTSSSLSESLQRSSFSLFSAMASSMASRVMWPKRCGTSPSSSELDESGESGSSGKMMCLRGGPAGRGPSPLPKGHRFQVGCG